MRPLTHKLWRDLVRLRGQALAVALVLACGVGMLVMGLGMRESLRAARDAYYRDYAMADVQVYAVRAPRRLLPAMAAIAGVQAVELRAAAGAVLVLPDVPELVSARLLSLPTMRVSEVNRLRLVAGRWPDPSRRDEVLVNEAFAMTHKLLPGSMVNATVRGRHERLRVVGWANSPEFVFVSAPGELFPQPGRFAVLWLDERALERAAGLAGAFNDAVFILGRGADAGLVRAELERLLKPYGVRTAFGRERMVSARFLDDELSQLSTMASTLPPIFLAVGAFLLHVTLSRLVATERANIGLLKAFGYGNAAIARHYAQGALLLALCGVVLGLGLGYGFGRWMAQVYRVFYRLPALPFEAGGGIWLAAVAVGLVAALAGALSALGQVLALSPAVALAPPAPAAFGRVGGGTRRYRLLPDMLARVVLRRISANPRRALSTLAGMALALAVLVVSQHFPAAIDRFLSVSFREARHQQATLTLFEAGGPQVLHAIRRLPGVESVEPVRVFEVIYGLHGRRVQEALIGMPAVPRLERLLDGGTHALRLRDDGLILSRVLARQLDAHVGDSIRVEATEGQRREVNLTVVSVADLWVGAAAYMEIGALGRTMGEAGRVGGAQLRFDPKYYHALNEALRKSPVVASISFTAQAEASMRKTFAEGSGFMATLFLLFAGLMAAGVAYATASVTLAEQQRDLATLRVLGYSRAEVAAIPLAEIAVLALLAIMPGLLLGYGFAWWLMNSFSNELFSLPLVVDRGAYARAVAFILAVVAGAAWLVVRRSGHLDLVACLKSRE